MTKVEANRVSLDEIPDGTAELDAEIAAARAQVAALRAAAEAGDPVAALVIKRLDEAQERLQARLVQSIYGGDE